MVRKREAQQGAHGQFGKASPGRPAKYPLQDHSPGKYREEHEKG